jgi:hypothetical protein
MEDIIVDVIANGRVLPPREIPDAVVGKIDVALARGEAPGEILYEGVRYLWLVRP